MTLGTGSTLLRNNANRLLPAAEGSQQVHDRHRGRRLLSGLDVQLDAAVKPRVVSTSLLSPAAGSKDFIIAGRPVNLTSVTILASFCGRSPNANVQVRHVHTPMPDAVCMLLCVV